MASSRRPWRTAARHGLAAAPALALAVGLTVAGSPSARATPPTSLRHVVLVEEQLDGAPQPTRSAEQELVRGLLAAGVPVVDEAQGRKLRAVTSATALLGGLAAEALTSVEADVIVAGVCRSKRSTSALLGAALERWDTVLEARLIAVDTGAVIAALRATGSATDLAARQPAERAQRSAAAALVQEILHQAEQAGGQAGPGQVTLSVQGVPDATAWEGLARALSAVPGVSQVRVLHADPALGKALLTVAHGTSARDLAVALDGISGLGLSVDGYSEREIRARYLLERSLQLVLVTTALAGADPRPGERTRLDGRLLAAILATSLLDVPFLRQPLGSQPQPLPPEGPPARWRDWLLGKGLAPERCLLLAGSLRPLAGEVHLEARLLAAPSGEIVLAGQRTCPATALSGCAVRLGEELAARLDADLLRSKRELLGGLAHLAAPGPGNGAAADAERRPLELMAVEVGELLPARLVASPDRAIGKIRVRNRGTEPLAELTVSAALPGFARSPLDVPLGQLAPGAELEAPLRLALERDSLLAHDESRSAVLELELGYTLGEYRYRQTRHQAVIVHDRNAMRWDEPDALAAFVTARVESVATLARAMTRDLPGEASQDAVARSMALFAGLGHLGLRYQADAVNPRSPEAIDAVQFPLQTLRRQVGDCEDLAVLYAALAEAAGLPVLLVISPGHVFAAAPTGLPASAVHLLTLDPKRILVHGGRAYLPLETTLLGRSFEEAWASAATELSRWQGEAGQLRIVEPRRAWQSYPPANLEREEPLALAMPDGQAAQLAAEWQAFRQARRSRAEGELAELGGGARPATAAPAVQLQRRGVLLTALGRLAEARVEFERGLALGEDKAKFLNNIGNLQAIERHASEALLTYDKALGHAPRHPGIHRNAALAAFAVGDQQTFTSHVLAMVEAGADEQVEELSRLTGSGGGGLKGSTAGSQEQRALAPWIAAALQQARGEARQPPTGAAAGVKAADATQGEDGAPLAQLLVWL